MQKTCKNCQVKFEVATLDLKFYDRIKVPEPTFCPDCRKQRRLTWRNERTLYSRPCNQCTRTTISIYSENKEYPVYCHDCWWSDDFTPLKYAKDFDFSRPFFEQFQELQLLVPRLALFNIEHENAEYANHAGNNKNCYLVFACFNSENVYYSRMAKRAKDCMDCSTLINNCELCYECIQCVSCYKSRYLSYCETCIDSFFLLDCKNCSNCFGCISLRNKRYQWFNEQLSPEEYQVRLQNYKSGSYSTNEQFKKKFQEHTLKYPRPHSYLINCEDCTGDELINCKHCYESYDIQNAVDCKYYETGSYVNDCYDVFGAGSVLDEGVNEFLYEVHGVIGSANQFCNACYQRGLKQYCDLCQNSEECFGSVGLKSNKYCIFNKQYSKDAYFALKEKIISQMKQNGEYGEFFPASISPFGYNETIAQEYYPLIKEEALKKGFNWSDYEAPPPEVEKIVKASDLPDSIAEVTDDILNQAIECEVTKKPFKIIPQELEFYRKQNIPIPRRHPDQRYKDRMALKNPRKLWKRQCMCSHAEEHRSHQGKSCPNTFQTTYAPDRPEMVYCESCYLKEVY